MPNFSWEQIKNRPAADDFEVSVIGPGFGECIIVYAAGRWIIVDSCRDPITRRPVAAHYLEALGVPLAEIKWIVATHWHSDHVSGIGELVQSASRAQFVCAHAIQNREFQSYSGLVRRHSVGDTVRDFRQAIESATNDGRLSWASAGTTLERDASVGGQVAFGLECLSPANHEYSLFVAQMAALWPKVGSPHRAGTKQDPNLTSIVLRVYTDRASALLGADLETHTSRARGWLAAVDQGRALSSGPSSLIKVPHHGSLGAHCDEMWSSLTQSAPTAVVTPYARGRKSSRPPTASDLKRIRSLSAELSITAPTEAGRIRDRKTVVGRTLSEHSIEVRRLGGSIGIVRYKLVGPGVWARNLYGRARNVSPVRRAG